MNTPDAAQTGLPTADAIERPDRGPRAHAGAGRLGLRRRPRAGPLDADEPAGLGPGTHRGVRGPVARASVRRPTAAARRPGRGLRRVRDPAREARRARRSCGRREAREYLARGPRSHARRDRGARQSRDGSVHEMVLRHEHQHDETMLQTLQLARLERLRARGPSPGASGTALRRSPGSSSCEVPAGPCTIGAAPDGFSYDNERPLHRTDVRGYLIGRTPITNATYLTFVEGGGYQRREWWSDEGWAWKENYDITRPGVVDRGPRRGVATG